MKYISTSVFELFKTGPGPSSSHTIGPMSAANNFLGAAAAETPAEKLGEAKKLRVSLYGSLSLTGKGHGTDRAVIAGLLGHSPGKCPGEILDSLPGSGPLTAKIGELSVPFSPADIIFEKDRKNFPFSNTLVISLLDSKSKPLFEREYYSVGGGFIQWKGWTPPPRGTPVYKYSSAAGVKKILNKEGLRLHELMIENEKAVTGASVSEIYSKIDAVLAAMEASVERGLKTEGVLPGPIGLSRKAPALFGQAERLPHSPDSLILFLSSYAFAASEENAAGHTIVTAPTCGSAGVIPAVYYLMKHRLRLAVDAMRDALTAAALIGFLARHNASIAGADVGCQGEIGVAAAMAAAMLAYAHSSHFPTAENAAETALEHHLGLTCDPVGGYVQIPCIERNAIGAVKAYTSFLIAKTEFSGHHKVDFDKVLEAMYETGLDMRRKYRETGKGGLAVQIKCS
jgi:L-serine dehydratase